jgi:hypothetical protein
MSDTPTAPGWWQASDGKWYPPQQVPGAVAHGYAYYPGQQTRGTSGKAVASLVLGILSIVFCYLGFIPGAIAIVLGVMAKRDIDREGLGGRGLAIAGLVCGIVGTSIQLIWDGVILLALLTSSSSSY